MKVKMYWCTNSQSQLRHITIASKIHKVFLIYMHMILAWNAKYKWRENEEKHYCITSKYRWILNNNCTTLRCLLFLKIECEFENLVHCYKISIFWLFGSHQWKIKASVTPHCLSLFNSKTIVHHQEYLNFKTSVFRSRKY